MGVPKPWTLENPTPRDSDVMRTYKLTEKLRAYLRRKLRVEFTASARFIKTTVPIPAAICAEEREATRGTGGQHGK